MSETGQVSLFTLLVIPQKSAFIALDFKLEIPILFMSG